MFCINVNHFFFDKINVEWNDRLNQLVSVFRLNWIYNHIGVRNVRKHLAFTRDSTDRHYSREHSSRSADQIPYTVGLICHRYTPQQVGNWVSVKPHSRLFLTLRGAVCVLTTQQRVLYETQATVKRCWFRQFSASMQNEIQISFGECKALYKHKISRTHTHPYRKILS